jgi:hypothetical protein
MSESPTPPTDQVDEVPPRRRRFGVGGLLIFVYAVLAIGATSRAVFQIITEYSAAPVPITLSAVSGVIYVIATLALILPGRAWYRIAWVTISFELLGVLTIGTLSVLLPSVFAGDQDISSGTVWSYYGFGYVFIPVVLPVLGLLWLRSRRAAVAVEATAVGPAAGA